MAGFDLQRLMSQAREQYESLQKKMAETVVEASAGGGTVKVRMNGQKQLLAITIDPEAVKSGDVEMLQDLVLAAVNEGARRVEDEIKSTVGGLLGGRGIPGL
ncbi:MAG TPA: YbaB/EbfC family nucleoid-associated protein [Terriglobales bacterium]|jgi:DNA-binding YbaB/EbfC family protein|nr:YbaB/EbfC family nucleoid-associated protein [Terriglobales bacterium]